MKRPILRPNAPSWARDMLLAQDPKTPPGQLAVLVLVGSFGADFEKLTAPQLSIIRAIAKNPNTPRDVLALLSEKFWHDLIKNPVLELLAVEDSNWCKSSLHNHLLRVAMPNLYREWLKEQDDAYREATQCGPRGNADQDEDPFADDEVW